MSVCMIDLQERRRMLSYKETELPEGWADLDKLPGSDGT